MKNLLFFLLLAPVVAFTQPLGTWPVSYGDTPPTHTPSGSGTRIYLNISTNDLWNWNPAPVSAWVKYPKGFDQISGCAAPAYTPTARQSVFAVNSCTTLQNGRGPELYQYTGSAWVCLNCYPAYTAGTGIGISSGVITNTLPDVTVSLTGGGINTVTGTYPNFTVTANEVDGSTTNELQNLSLSGQSLSISGGTGATLPVVGVTAGTGIGVSSSSGNFTVSNTAPDQTVSISGVGITPSGTYPNFTLTAADQSATNEIQTLSLSGSDLSLSLGGGTVTLPGGADGNGIYSGSGVLSGNTLVDLNLNNLTFDNGQISFSTGEGGFFSMSGTTINVNGDGNFEGGTYGFLAEENLFFVGNGNIQVTSGNGLGFQYAAEYPDILTNDRSIPDVGLIKQLISSENGALGTGFTDGGGAGTVPANTTITIQSDPSNGNFILDVGQPSADGWEVEIGDYNSVSGVKTAIGFGAGTVFLQAGTASISADGINEEFSMNSGAVGLTFGALFAQIAIRNGASQFQINDQRATPVGLEYNSDYSATIKTNNRSIPDVGTVNLLKQAPASYTNAAAPNNTIFYSTTDSKLSYKDPGGTVHSLY